jgi:aerobic-type carbon monoxide dehydrogenase small subunit (CoxS/CutS family)
MNTELTTTGRGGTVDGGGFAGYGEPAVTTTLVVDDVEYHIVADPTMASLKAIREIAEHVRPRRGCQEGICGKCESKVTLPGGEATDTRLCITPIGSLVGARVVTPVPRKSMWG